MSETKDEGGAIDSGAEETQKASPTKRRRGRPSKKNVEDNGEKSPKRTKHEAEEEGEGGDSSTADTSGGSTNAAPVKRGRGRPRKDPNAPQTPRKQKKSKEETKSASEAGTEAQAQSPVKRGRGRPRKDSNAPPTPKKSKTAPAQKSSTGRGRGRPRKHPLPDADSSSKPSKKRNQKETETENQHSHSHSHSHSQSHSSGAPSRFLEKGWIYFFYRPKVEKKEVASFQDVQKLYMLLVPKTYPPSSPSTSTATSTSSTSTSTSTSGSTSGGEEEGGIPGLGGQKQRLIVLTKKKLPEIHSHSRYWGFVEEVGDRFEEIHDDLDKVYYTTKTRGHRTLEAARPAGFGFYGIIEHDGHTHLAYVLELPKDIGRVQKAFHIQKEGSYIIAVKNPSPDLASRDGFEPPERAHLPDELLEKFKGKRWIPVVPVSLLDHEHVELIIIGASDDLKEELGSLGQQLEREEEKDARAHNLNDNTLFEELHMSKKTHPPLPLLKGTWQ